MCYPDLQSGELNVVVREMCKVICSTRSILFIRTHFRSPEGFLDNVQSKRIRNNLASLLNLVSFVKKPLN